MTRLLLLLVLACPLLAQGTKPLTVEDIMDFRKITAPALSADGAWIGYVAEPDRGDREVVLRATAHTTTYSIPLGSKLAFANGAAFAAVELGPDALFQETAEKKARDAFKSDLVLIDLSSGERTLFPRTKAWGFSEDGGWLASMAHPPELADKPAEGEKKADPLKDEDDLSGGTLRLRKLASGHEILVENVVRFAFSGKGAYVAYVCASEDGSANGLFLRHLAGDHTVQVTVSSAGMATFPQLAWDRNDGYLAFLEGRRSADSRDLYSREHRLIIRDTKTAQLREVAGLASDSFFPFYGGLRWSRDSDRLFSGTRPKPIQIPSETSADAKPTAADLKDVKRLLKKSSLDVWHELDDRIQTQARTRWEKYEKKRTYAAVCAADGRKLIILGRPSLPMVLPGEQSDYLLALDDAPYRIESTWDRDFADFYVVNLKTGESTLVAKRLAFDQDGDSSAQISLSPGGRYVAYYNEGQIYLYAIRSGKTTCLSEGLNISFAVEDYDLPSPPPGYDFAGWLADDAGILVNDRYDVWVLPNGSAKAYRLTGGYGREQRRSFRVIATDEERLFYKPGEKVLLSSYHEVEKNFGFYQAEIGKDYVIKRLEDKKRYNFLAKAKHAEVIIYTREDFREFPDIWGADSWLNLPKRLTSENPQLNEFAFGAPQLVKWDSLLGKPCEGVLYLPGNYVPGERYPVIVYFYEKMSDRLYRFNEMAINHRPNFGLYTSNGYAVFLPDVDFRIGTPGASASNALIPGVQKLVEMGVADPKALGLHGHSWGGYETAFMVTQSNVFAAAVAGAPVSNMTSAYSGIRLESGRARQFQYEISQSRLGASLWERRDLYIENSPVFFADRIETPLLIEFGDKDEAVPWQQGVELYLAMRRNGKKVVMLQYHDEPHHLKKYPNKLDYTLKMKAFFDHYLKGEPAPEWLVKGVPYQGE